LLTAADITTFSDTPAPPGASPYLPGYGPTVDLSVVPYDESWPAAYESLAARIRAALGPLALGLDHVGSTSVPGLAAKPTIDIDLTVLDGTAENSYAPALVEQGFQLVIREPWWYEHRLLRHRDPGCNLHVWSVDCAEAARHLIFRDWLRAHPEDCERYLAAKRVASEATAAAGGNVIAYNLHKQDVIREIYGRAFAELGLSEGG
jgi:GrpB-like predicted nucleotidyltransferase (UPF0157 family)